MKPPFKRFTTLLKVFMHVDHGFGHDFPSDSGCKHGLFRANSMVE